MNIIYFLLSLCLLIILVVISLYFADDIVEAVLIFQCLVIALFFMVTVHGILNSSKIKELKWYSNESYINMIDDNTVELKIIKDNEIKIQNFNLHELNIHESIKDKNYITFNKKENDDLYLNVKDYELIMEYKNSESH